MVKHMLNKLLAFAVASTLSVPALADSANDLFGLNLTQLMNLKVISATKRSQTLADTAAAMTVISQEDIRRSGATTIPELLQQVPGVEVARINGSTWAVTVRGFQSQFANKLLVLIDGRSVYTPLFSGVYWDAQMPMMEDIDHIEVIRGPGSSLWGSNAVNGVINIITKHSADTVGNLATVGMGDVEKGFYRVRSGWESTNASARISAQYRNRGDSLDAATGGSADDAYTSRALDGRVDWQAESEDRFTLQGGYQKLEKNNNLSLLPYVAAQIPDFKQNIGSDNANILFRWQHPFNNGNSHEFQTYLDWTHRNESTYDYRRTTVDMDYQYNVRKIGMQRLTMGLNYRFISDDFNGTFAFDLANPNLDYDQGTTFIQDEITFSDKFATIVGVKLEATAFTHFEYQPTARFLWTPSNTLTFWSAISRAVATPSRASRGITVRNSLPPATEAAAAAAVAQMTNGTYTNGTIYGVLSGSPTYDSESVQAYEFGYRQQITPILFVDATTYYNVYHNLRTFDSAGYTLVPGTPPDYIASVNFRYGNAATAHSSGFELATNWYPTDNWLLKLSYTYFNLVVDPINGKPVLGASELSDQSPLHQASLHSRHDFGQNWELDWTLRYYDQLPNDAIKAYTDMDFRVGYQANPQLEVALVGKDLFASPRTEFQDTIQGPYRTEMPRSLFVQATWQMD